ncbi:hypothetical protein EWI11_14105 [Enterococcus faecium]|uniref:Uncharacterized protein n=1 Tax=Enterococcus faecium TaxID=1352 RepID=A0AB73TKU7_ENTFC|nr:hypothetical protein AWJ25_03805 [Enterococcus faecium]EJX39083.1 hypothetical protein HMPREF1383_02115 [Enterococcus faecium V689]EJX55709.1 hypothetical protein HMPREF1377_02081 [Enterococcus faecium R494]EJY26052.1 hypothetical protein HMPREF1353_02992 [Enterococcus faecium 513]EJY49096.1 hypothetical protein HMPREF1346_02821 [Enterococcus faecium 503]OFK45772.1 hypothetical protein HMPREF2816_09665 [Enterococcus sp. HMSC073E08]OFL40119.1 hypothetical protein HMPREF2769_13265 [Enterococ
MRKGASFYPKKVIQNNSVTIAVYKKGNVVYQALNRVIVFPVEKGMDTITILLLERFMDVI